MGSEHLLFYGFAALALGGSLRCAQRNPVYSVISLIVAFFGLSGLYVLLESPFAAVVQIIIYAGAIMVLFLFVVMLLNAPREDATTGTWRTRLPAGSMRLGAVLAVAFGAQVLWALTRTPGLGAASARRGRRSRACAMSAGCSSPITCLRSR